MTAEHKLARAPTFASGPPEMGRDKEPPPERLARLLNDANMPAALVEVVLTVADNLDELLEADNKEIQECICAHENVKLLSGRRFIKWLDDQRRQRAPQPTPGGKNMSQLRQVLAPTEPRRSPGGKDISELRELLGRDVADDQPDSPPVQRIAETAPEPAWFPVEHVDGAVRPASHHVVPLLVDQPATTPISHSVALAAAQPAAPSTSQKVVQPATAQSVASPDSRGLGHAATAADQQLASAAVQQTTPLISQRASVPAPDQPTASAPATVQRPAATERSAKSRDPRIAAAAKQVPRDVVQSVRDFAQVVRATRELPIDYNKSLEERTRVGETQVMAVCESAKRVGEAVAQWQRDEESTARVRQCLKPVLESAHKDAAIFALAAIHKRRPIAAAMVELLPDCLDALVTRSDMLQSFERMAVADILEHCRDGDHGDLKVLANNWLWILVPRDSVKKPALPSAARVPPRSYKRKSSTADLKRKSSPADLSPPHSKHSRLVT